jgi:hypothetical protein
MIPEHSYAIAFDGMTSKKWNVSEIAAEGRFFAAGTGRRRTKPRSHKESEIAAAV